MLRVLRSLLLLRRRREFRAGLAPDRLVSGDLLWREPPRPSGPLESFLRHGLFVLDDADGALGREELLVGSVEAEAADRAAGEGNPGLGEGLELVAGEPVAVACAALKDLE